MKRFYLSLLLISVFVSNVAYAQYGDTYGSAPQTAAPSSSFYLGFNLGPEIQVKPSGGGTIFKFGPEIGGEYMMMPILFGFKDGSTTIDLIPRFKYDISLIDRLVLAPFGGLDLGFGFSDFGKVISLGIDVGMRATYMVLPQMGLFIEPVSLNFIPIQWVFPEGQDSTSSTDLNITYKLLFGANYHF